MTYDAIHPNRDIARRLTNIYALHRVDSDFRLENSPYNDLLAALGNPHLRLPPVIHLSGTNGKGSTQAFIKSIYEQAGYTVHSYTSPHLRIFNERITVANSPVSDDMLLHYLDMTDTANNGNAVTFFEYTTAMAFKIFADNPADICILETGLGGRLDCTNIVPAPVATGITSIGLDHTDYLGDTIASIAWEKAGIMKESAPCIVARQAFAPQTTPVFEKTAAEKNCPVMIEGKDWNMTDYALPPLPLIGQHQNENAATAIHIIQTLGKRFPVSQKQINDGLSQARWPGRMEEIVTGRLITRMPRGSSLWFDCGHNREGAQTIAVQLRAWKTENPARPIHVILGLAADKDAAAFAAPILGYCDSLTCVDLLNARNPQTGISLAKKIGKPDIKTSHNIADAITTTPQENAIYMVCGSLYLYSYL